MSVSAQSRGLSGAGRRRAGIVIGLFAVLLGAALPALAAGHIVQARNYQFVAPGGGSTLTVSAGDEVTWVSSGDPHTVTSGAPGAIDNRFVDRPASVGILTDGDTFTTTFPSLGSYPYFCEIHPEQMTGVVTVVAAASAPPTAVPPTAPPSSAPTPRPTTAPATAAPTPPPAPTRSPAPSGTPAATVTATVTIAPTVAAPPSASTGGTSPGTPTPTGAASTVLPASAGPTTEPGVPASGSRPSATLPLVLVGLLGALALGGILLARRSGRGGQP